MRGLWVRASVRPQLGAGGLKKYWARSKRGGQRKSLTNSPLTRHISNPTLITSVRPDTLAPGADGPTLFAHRVVAPDWHPSGVHERKCARSRWCRFARPPAKRCDPSGIELRAPQANELDPSGINAAPASSKDFDPVGIDRPLLFLFRFLFPQRLGVKRLDVLS